MLLVGYAASSKEALEADFDALASIHDKLQTKNGVAADVAITLLASEADEQTCNRVSVIDASADGLVVCTSGDLRNRR